MRRTAALTRRGRVVLGSLLALALALGLFGVVSLAAGGAGTITISARFATAPGLYAGNGVRILGMPVGTVVSVTPGPSYVTVVMSLPAGIPVPAGVRAYVMAPQVVNDRYVELDPAWTSGPRLGAGAVIPLGRTAVPISVDAIVDSLDALAEALGPNGLNAHGALSGFVSGAAAAFGGDGSALHSTLDSLGSALGALSAKGPQLTALLDNLGSLSKAASTYTSTYQAFAGNLAAVSTELAADDAGISSALHELQLALGGLAEFVHEDGSALGASVKDLDVFAAAVASRQQQLAAALGTLPIGLDNLTSAYDATAPGGPALRTRLDPLGDSAGFATSVCGDPLLRLLLLSVDQQQDRDLSVDLGCGVDGLLAGLPTPPGASSGPDLSLAALLGGKP